MAYTAHSFNLFLSTLSDSSPRRKPGSSSSSKKRSDPHRSPQAKRAQNRHDSDSDQSPPRKKTLKGEGSDSDQSPPRKIGRGSDSDQSPPRRRARTGKDSDGDLSPPRRPGQVSELCLLSNIKVDLPRIAGQAGAHAAVLFASPFLCVFDFDVQFLLFSSQGPRMLSGGTAGLVSVDVLRKEQEENRRRERNNQPLEGWLNFSFKIKFHHRQSSQDFPSRIIYIAHASSKCLQMLVKLNDAVFIPFSCSRPIPQCPDNIPRQER